MDTSCALWTPFSCTILLLVGKNSLYNLLKVLTTAPWQNPLFLFRAVFLTDLDHHDDFKRPQGQVFREGHQPLPRGGAATPSNHWVVWGGFCTSAMLRDQEGPEAWRQYSKQWSNKFSSARGWWSVESTLATQCSRNSPTTTSRMPRTPRRPSLSYKRRSNTSKPKFMMCKIKTVSMNIDLKRWVWLQIWGFRRLGHPSMMVSLCHGSWTTRLHHRQYLHHQQQRRRHNHMGMGTPLGNCQAWGVPWYRITITTPIFTIFLSSILLVVSWFSRIKSCHDLVLSFALWSFFVIEFVSYIIKISVQSWAWLFCHDLGWLEEKE